ncbi:hypothetical protein, partial [Alteromonas sp. a30]|uniref:hypothetical protein n=1 Tax=Alteromonas sp. a30 TaxID=2730917 RepID=UPI00227EE5F8
LDARDVPKPLSESQQTQISHCYLFDAPNLTAVLPSTEGLAPFSTVTFKRALSVKSGTLIPFDFNSGAELGAGFESGTENTSSVTNLLIEDSDGVLHTDTQLIYSTPEAITATLNTQLDWEITRGS